MYIDDAGGKLAGRQVAEQALDLPAEIGKSAGTDRMEIVIWGYNEALSISRLIDFRQGNDLPLEMSKRSNITSFTDVRPIRRLVLVLGTDEVSVRKERTEVCGAFLCLVEFGQTKV